MTVKLGQYSTGEVKDLGKLRKKRAIHYDIIFINQAFHPHIKIGGQSEKYYQT